MLNLILHPSQQHDFTGEESWCWTGLPTVQNFHQWENKKRSRTVEQLEFCIRQEWDNISLLKLQQLVSSLPRCLQPNLTFLRCVAAIKVKMNFQWNVKISQFQHFSSSLCSIGHKIWVSEIYKLLHSVFISLLHSVPAFLGIGLILMSPIYLHLFSINSELF